MIDNEFEFTQRMQKYLPNVNEYILFPEYCKKIAAYLKKNNQPLTKIKDYVKKYNEEEFDELIKQHYVIKGKEITAIKIFDAVKKENYVESEHDIQVKVCKYLDKMKLKYFAVPNGFIYKGEGFNNDSKEKRISTACYINYLHSEGLRNGSPDLVILLGNGKVIFLETKTKRGKPSEFQKNWKKYFDENGYTYKICYGYDECIEYIEGKNV